MPSAGSIRARRTVDSAAVTLHRYILRLVVVSILFSVGSMGFMAVPGLAINALQRLGGAGIATLLYYLPLVGAELVPYLVPMGFLLAVVSTYGRLAADREWTAICMAGIHPMQMLMGPFAIALILSGGTYWLLANVTPHLLYKQRAVIKNRLVEQFRNLNPGRPELSLGDFRLMAQYREGDVWRDAVIQVPEIDGMDAIALRADVARLWMSDEDTLSIHLTRGRAVLRGEATNEMNWEDSTISVPLDQLFEIEPDDHKRARYLDNATLREQLRSGELSDYHAHGHRYELHRRGATATSYILLLLLGAPTGLLLRRGTQLSALAVAVLFGLLYYLFSLRLGKELAGVEAVPPWISAWAVNALGCVVGLFLMWRASRR